LPILPTLSYKLSIGGWCLQNRIEDWCAL